jgi:hypothetical protein
MSLYVCMFLLYTFIILLSYWWYIVTFTKVTMVQYTRVEFTPSSSSFKPPSPHSWNSFSMSHFSFFMHEYIIFHHIHPPTPFPYILLPPTGPTPQTGPVLPSISSNILSPLSGDFPFVFHLVSICHFFVLV